MKIIAAGSEHRSSGGSVERSHLAVHKEFYRLIIDKEEVDLIKNAANGNTFKILKGLVVRVLENTA